MDTQQQLDFKRIATAIEYISQHFKEQPTLEEVAAKVNLSSFHFQRLFTAWAGVSPKNFLQYISINYAKSLLKENQATLSETAYETGLSATSRLHDLFIKIEGMTPAEYKHGGRNLRINYSFAESPFGNILVATTQKGICYLAFAEDDESEFNRLVSLYPNATFQHKVDFMQQNALFIFRHDWSGLKAIQLHLKATGFQLKVWETLLRIPEGKLATYGQIAGAINNPGASRAVGTAIGDNPVAYLIPCHRVIQSSGNFGQYHWGKTRKAAIIGWEAARHHHG